MKESYKDTDLREALRRKYSETPQLPADFMEKMQQRLQPKPVAKTRRLWSWVAAAASLLILIVVGITMLPKDQTQQTKDIVAQNINPQKTGNLSTQEDQEDVMGPTTMEQEKAQHPATTPNLLEIPESAATAKANKPVVAETHTPSETSPSSEVYPSAETPAAYRPAQETNLHYASQLLTEDSTYQEPSKMDEFIAKIADFNKVKAVPLDCISENGDNAVVNTAYVFPDTKELNLFGRLLQAACSYDSKTPGYLLNFSHQQFFFTLKDLRKGEKYLWIAERINGSRILLYTTHSPVEANVSTACYQNYREQLTHTYLSSLQY